MADQNDIHSPGANALSSLQSPALNGSVIQLSGAGKAYQSVSQSSAIAVQDATDNLRNINTMATTAMGVALAQMLATGDAEKYGAIITQANNMVVKSTENFTKVGSGASELLGEFPTGG